MKKILSILLVLAMSVSVMAGCKDKAKQEQASTEETKQEKITEEEKETEEKDSEKKTDKEKVEEIVEEYLEAVQDGDIEKAVEYITGDYKEEMEKQLDKEYVSENILKDIFSDLDVELDNVKDEGYEIYIDALKEMTKLTSNVEITEVSVDGDEASVTYTAEYYDENSIDSSEADEKMNEVIMEVFGISDTSAVLDFSELMGAVPEDEREEKAIEFFEKYMNCFVELCKQADKKEKETEVTLVKEDGEWLISEENDW
ncbi:MAG: hypothetical protein Q4B31_01075 [Clostridia bacterium]|nr:hypothetical protein [Clostridia bacterium]